MDIEIKPEQQIKYVILGAHCSGKSALFQQLRLLSDPACEFRKEELRTTARATIVKGLRELTEEMEQMQCTSEKLERAKEVLQQKEGPAGHLITREESEKLEEFWKDKDVQQIVKEKRKKGVINICGVNNFEYLMNSIQRYCSEQSSDSIMTTEDALNIYNKNASFEQTTARVQDAKDKSSFQTEVYCHVGGARTVRKKWIHYFDDVSVLLFVADSVSINQDLLEDPSTLKFFDEFDLFNQLAPSRWFTKTVKVVLLNKCDELARLCRDGTMDWEKIKLKMKEHLEKMESKYRRELESKYLNDQKTSMTFDEMIEFYTLCYQCLYDFGCSTVDPQAQQLLIFLTTLNVSPQQFQNDLVITQATTRRVINLWLQTSIEQTVHMNLKDIVSIVILYCRIPLSSVSDIITEVRKKVNALRSR
ncbi:guanine nucleotide-binding protein alpha subunit [Reticulomyxa filosa]|uniref:Guanine nucleotide-binding protein alpha subunit n=1 Tax=Reticulomyxa filosa TaxID=46433 RepID=X6MNJ7_RETFI|nr:guanine nucleotide-binding protein alpha subunit [Reticulomyxa filosa]|eukprot:ETO15399.1 guanine nucleotide-binding protein alpha subunit [Reticulomyxa filosa]